MHNTDFSSVLLAVGLFHCTLPHSTVKAFQLQYSSVLCIYAENKRRRFSFSFLKFVTSCGRRSVYTNNSLICANRANHLGLISEDGMHLCFVLYAVRSAYFNIRIFPALALRKGRVLHNLFSCSDLGWVSSRRPAGYRCVSSDFASHLPGKFNITLCGNKPEYVLIM